MESKLQVVLVTEALGPAGNTCAAFLAKRGFRVYGACKTPGAYTKKADEFFDLLAMDPSDQASLARALETIHAKEGSVDALVVYPAESMDALLPASSSESIRQYFEATVVAPLAIASAAIRFMAQTGRGNIIIQASSPAWFSGKIRRSFSSILAAFVESLSTDHISTEIRIARLLAAPDDWTETARAVYRALTAKQLPKRIVTRSLIATARAFAREYLPFLRRLYRAMRRLNGVRGSP